GLMSLMPISFTIALIGSFSMAGLPPFNGFLSKEMFLTGMLSIPEFDFFAFDTWGILFPIIAWVASVFTFVYSFYFVFRTFTGKHKPDLLPKQAHEAPVGMLISPAILGSLVVAIFFIPNVIGDALVKPAVLAIQPFLYTSTSEIHIHISAWHGFKPELQMTIGIIIIGYLLYRTLSKWQPLYSKFPEGFSLNRLYDSMMFLSEAGTNRLSRLYMTGYMRSYLVYMFTGIILLTISTVFIQNAFDVSFAMLAPIRFFELVIALVLVAGTVTILLAKSRLTSIIALGAVGYTVALFFVIFNAPDLALTQLVIETVSVALFLLAFYHLPKLNRHENRMKFRLGNALVAFGVGVTVTIVALSAHSQKLVPSISSYYEETVYKEAGGGNIVNVILVDYRGFDTLFEIAVLAIASLGIIAMINLRLTKKKEVNRLEDK
ncbi:MAG: hydrogen gas-evolving membrane-bound hydrogenase subunit E, partial [Paenisporosarcina sp.]